MTVMIGSRMMLWNQMACSRSGVTPGCRSMAPEVGWPILSSAQAAALQNAAPAPTKAPAARVRNP